MAASRSPQGTIGTTMNSSATVTNTVPPSDPAWCASSTSPRPMITSSTVPSRYRTRIAVTDLAERRMCSDNAASAA